VARTEHAVSPGPSPSARITPSSHRGHLKKKSSPHTKVLLDIHALEGSQNGLDNSGRAADVRWTANVFSDAPVMQGRTFSHWATRKAEWMGKFNLDSLSYTEVCVTQLLLAAQHVQQVVFTHRLGQRQASVLAARVVEVRLVHL
jgi:hypothetical protein